MRVRGPLILRLLRWFRKWRLRQKDKPVAMPSAPSEEASTLQSPSLGQITQTAPTESPQPPSTTSRERIPSIPPPGSGSAEPPRDVNWAQRQGGKDRVAGVACWSYAAFLAAYGLPRNPSSLRLWAAYMPLGEQHLPARGRTRTPERTVPPARTPSNTGPVLSPLREKELRNQGAEALGRSDGVVTFRVTGRVVEQIRIPDGPQAAAQWAAAFNASVRQLRINPPDTLNDVWR